MRIRTLFLISAWACLSACAAFRSSPPAWVQETLYFGQGMKDGGQVSETQWQAFMQEVSLRFPDGLTQWQAQGQWRQDGKTLAEPSRVLVLIHAPSPSVDASLEAVIDLYKRRFQQDSVLRVRQAVEAHF